jgi:hypothetical protein
MIKRKVDLLHSEFNPCFAQKPLMEFTSWQVMGQLLPIWHILPHDPSRCSSTVRILAKKRRSGWITTLVPIKQEIVRKRQVIQKCPFLGPLWQLVEGRVSFCVKVMYCSTQTRYGIIMVDDINLTSPRDLTLAMRWTLWVRVWNVHHLGLGWKTIFSMKWSSCLNINMSSNCSTKPEKFLDDKLVFHLEILQNIILKVFPYSMMDPLVIF